MRRTWLLVVVAVLAAAEGCGPGTGRPNAAGEIVALERQALDEWSRANPSGYAAHFADDATYFDDIGAQSRVEGIVAVRSYLASLEGKIPRHTYELVDPRVQVYGDVGILTFRWNAFTPGGDPLPQWKATVVYRHDGGAWRTVHSNWLVVKDPSPESPR